MAAATANRQMIPDLQSYYDQIESVRQEVERITGGLTEAQMEWTPAADTWSLVQMCDHLNKVGYLLLPKLQEAIQQGKTQRLYSEGPFHYNLIERWFIRMLSPGANMKVPVPPLYVPAAPKSIPDALPRFLALQRELQDCIVESNGLDLTRLKITSPASRLLRMCLGAWISATVAHERYHLEQMQALRADTHFPS